MSNNRATALQSRIAVLLKNPLNSDITIFASDGTIFPAHLTILHTCTPFFSSALSSSSGFAEATSHEIHLPEHEPQHINAFLSLCYTGWYTCPDGTTTENQPYFHMEVFKLIDYVLAEVLKPSVIDAFKMSLEGILKKLNNVLQEGQEIISFWTEGMPEIVEELYSGNAWGEVKKAMCDMLVQGLLEGWPWEPFVEVAGRRGEFATEIMGLYQKAVTENFDLLKIPKPSDVTIITKDGITFPAHLDILSTCTDFFNQAVALESAPNFRSYADKTVELDFPPEVVENFLRLVYTGDYNSTTGKPCILGLWMDTIVAKVEAVKVFGPKVLAHFKKDLDAMLGDPNDSGFWLREAPLLLEWIYKTQKRFGTVNSVLKNYILEAVATGILDGRGPEPFRGIIREHYQAGDEVMTMIQIVKGARDTL